ncbi:MAG TPA: potassium-transporting ATPase subunit KdpC [Roseiarcus sp.]|nr:potassium-transporting ATPase subunit KdpC [Roseiarcus sp.]
MLGLIRPAVVLLALFSALTGLAYPLAITGVAQLAFNAQADGGLVTRHGVVVGSRLIGQNFASAKYFHSRPSATQAPDPRDASKTIDAPYNAANSTGSNLGPTSRKLIDRVKAGVAAAHAAGVKGAIPADAVTTSGSGLDPDISPAYALAQVDAVSAVRGLAPEKLRAVVEANVEAPALGLIGEPRVNVLELNLALDQGLAAEAAK